MNTCGARKPKARRPNLSFRGARQREPQMCNCTSGNLEIPGSPRSLSSGRALRGPGGVARNDGDRHATMIRQRSKVRERRNCRSSLASERRASGR